MKKLKTKIKFLQIKNLSVFCKQFHNNYFVIPIQSFHEPVRDHYSSLEKYENALAYFKLVVNRDEQIYDQYYFPLIEDGKVKRHRRLVLSDSRFVHKSMIFNLKEENALSSKDLKEIGKRLMRMLNIKTNEGCKGKNCEYYRLYPALKGLLNRVERIEKDA